MQPEGQKMVGRSRAMWSDKVGIRYLLGSSSESTRVEEKSERGQDCWVAAANLEEWKKSRKEAKTDW